MKKETIKLIVLLTTISLLGLIFTQLFWIKNAIDQSENQFDHRISMALSKVLDDMVELNELNRLQKRQYISESCGNDLVTVIHYLDTSLVDSLLKAKFEFYCLDSIFDFGIIHAKNDSAWTSEYGLDQGRKKITRYKICLKNLFKTQNYNLEVYFPEKRKFILLSMSAWLTVSILFLFVVTGSFIYTIMAILRQKKISEIKNDFINNMTHEFKTPISTISLASEVLIQNKGTDEQLNKYSKVIFEENQRLKTQVERVLQMAKLDKGELKLRITEVNIHELIKDTVENLYLDYCEKPVSLVYQFYATNSIIQIDKVHMTNIINNLIDNAHKYSYNNLRITISTKNSDRGIIIVFRDNGIGMSKETQKHIFDKFYRIPTGNIHNVKGFGLGLNYVKSLINAHSGTISIKSELKKGSIFTIFLPFIQLS